MLSVFPPLLTLSKVLSRRPFGSHFPTHALSMVYKTMCHSSWPSKQPAGKQPEEIELSNLLSSGKRAPNNYNLSDCKSPLPLALPPVALLPPLPLTSFGDGSIPEIDFKYESLHNKRILLEEQIVKEWKIVWLGLFETDNKIFRTHNSQLQALYYGAGLSNPHASSSDATIDALNWDPTDYRFNNGIVTLKLFENLPIFILCELIDLLGAYKEEIRSMDNLHSMLESKQLGIYQVIDFKKNSNLREEYSMVKEQMEERISGYNEKMNHLKQDILEEATRFAARRNYGPPKGKYVYMKAFQDRTFESFEVPFSL